MKLAHLDGKTLDVTKDNILKLKQIFPEVVTEGKIDFDKLQQILGEYVEDSKERYNFTWNGKGQALRLSQTPSMGTLRPCKEESKDWDTTQNLYIEGDNLEVLKLLQKSYFGKIKMIYIDPPYNTGEDYVYKDDFHNSLENYKKITGQVDEEGRALSTNSEKSGRYHTDWLNMMYPRLRLARNLLSDDGVIFIHIDDNEVHNLRKITDEIYGEENFLSQLCIQTGEVFGRRAAHAEKTFIKVKDYIISYQKMKMEGVKRTPLFDRNLKTYDSHFDIYYDGKDRININEYLSEHKKLSELFKLNNIDINEEGINILLSTSKEFYETFMDEIANNLYQDQPYTRKIDEEIVRKLKYGEIMEHDNNLIFKTSTGSIRMLDNFGEKIIKTDDYFSSIGRATIRGDLWLDFHIDMRNIKREGDVEFNDGKKPKRLIKQLIKWINSSNGIILDFFSGSATTAHSVMELNFEDGGNRKFIMVQLQEPTDEDSEAYKVGYKNISEIGKERIRRAGEKIKSDNKDKENIENLDIGFKVFKLDTSNIRKWEPDYDNLEQSLLDYVDNYVEGRTEADVVYEIMLKYGLDLSYPVDEFIISGKKVYSIGYGMLMICLDDEIITDVAKGILEKAKELKAESTRVVFKDNGFKTDSNKTNIKEILKSGGIEEFITV